MTGCLGETQIAQFLEGELAASEVEQIDSHVDECESCRGLLADLMIERSKSSATRREAGEPTSSVAFFAGRSRDASTKTEVAARPRERAPASLSSMRRYDVLDLIGKGGMGRVYRAVDRVTGRAVALKRVVVGGSPEPLDRATDPDVAVGDSAATISLSALAQEFRVLAALRHPNIISVLDYGFDAERRPYLVMELLEASRPVLPSAITAPREAQVELLCQILRALNYMHRRGILHRDLKPSNILITEGGALKVLDFGLAMGSDEARFRPAAGTLPYMAPELFLGGASSEASDLYAVGVIAYEMLTGQRPFRAGTTAELIGAIINAEPDLTPIPPELRGLVGEALRKSPGDRPKGAATLLLGLSIAASVPVIEPSFPRDSYLMAARFIGRKREAELLSHALSEARRGRGSAWLVGGESGVGKSRLLEELRSRALIEGVIAARGQALPSGGTAFHVFSGALEVLALHVELSPLEASVLKAVLPNLGALLARPIADAPELDVQATRFRLLNVLRDFIQRSGDPALILLEDLQWADAESLSLLAEVSAGVRALPILLVASFRDDEAKGLSAALPAFSTLRLPRFSGAEIALLCSSMLGPAGRDPDLVRLVTRETEGNAYFIVEAMRALAEESGGLDHVGREGVPERLLAHGIESVLSRRLSRVPADARPLLELAAVSGRLLDLDVLSKLVPNISEVIQACAEVGVLEVHEQRYRYGHDKLRERVLQAIGADRRRALHERVAAALVATYPESHAHAAEIALHFREAERPVEAAHHYAIAGEAALARGAPGEAEAAFEQAIALHRRIAPPQLTEVRVWRGLAEARFGLGQLTEADAALRHVFDASGAPLPTTNLGFFRVLGREIAEQVARRAGLWGLLFPEPPSPTEEALREERLLALSIQEAYIWLGQPEMLLLTTLFGLNLEEATSLTSRSNFTGAMAFLLSCTKLRGLSGYYLARSATAAKAPGTAAEIGFLRAQALVLINEGRWSQAFESAARAVLMSRAQKDDLSEMRCLVQLQTAAVGLDDFGRIEEAAHDIERISTRAKNPWYLAIALLSKGSARLRFGDVHEAEEAIARAEAIIPRESGSIPEALRVSLLSACALMQGQHGRALDLADVCLRLVQQMRFKVVELRLPIYCVLDVYLSLDEPSARALKIEAGLSILNRMVAQLPFMRAAISIFQARWELARGRSARAAELLRGARASAEGRDGSRYEVAMARFSLGNLAQSDDGRTHVPEGPEVHLRAALALFEQVDARFEAEKTRAALRGRRFPLHDGPRSGRAQE